MHIYFLSLFLKQKLFSLSVFHSQKIKFTKRSIFVDRALFTLFSFYLFFNDFAKKKKEKCFEISSHALALVQIVVGIEPRSLTHYSSGRVEEHRSPLLTQSAQGSKIHFNIQKLVYDDFSLTYQWSTHQPYISVVHISLFCRY